MELEFHPIANCWRLIEGDDFDNLVQDIKAHGLHNPIVIFEDKILDGRNRYRACKLAGIDPHFVAYGDWDDQRIERSVVEDSNGSHDYEYSINLFGRPDEEDGPESDDFVVAKFYGPLSDPISFAKSLNDMRRHDNESQRSMTAAKLATLPKGRPSENSAMALLNTPTQEEAASMMDVSVDSVKRARVVIDKGADELIDAVELGQISVRAASDIAANVPKPQQAEIVARGEKEILEAAKAIRQEKAEARRAELAVVKQNKPSLPAGKYETIVIDPPWQMEKIERDVAPNQVAFEYPTMSEIELSEFDVPSIAADDCHMFCWTTHKFLPSAMRLIEAWGFRYVYLGTWHKNGGFQPFGLPQYNSEFYIYARKGTPRFSDTKQFFTCFQASRREHSRKPDEFYDVIRRVTDGPRIDVFSREARDGFDQFGNESEKFGEDAA